MNTSKENQQDNRESRLYKMSLTRLNSVISKATGTKRFTKIYPQSIKMTRWYTTKESMIWKNSCSI